MDALLSDLWGKPFVLTDVLTIELVPIDLLNDVFVDVCIGMLDDMEIIVVAPTVITVEFAPPVS